MGRWRRFLKRILGRLAWAMLRAAEFDKIANELLHEVEVLRDPAAQMQRRFAELEGRIGAVQKRVDNLEAAVPKLQRKLNTAVLHTQTAEQLVTALLKRDAESE